MSPEITVYVNQFNPKHNFSTFTNKHGALMMTLAIKICSLKI